jgi:hypothetical protein
MAGTDPDDLAPVGSDAMGDEELDLGFTRDDIVQGMPMRRAKSLVFLIEQEAQRQRDRQRGVNSVALAAASTAGAANIDLAEVLDAEARRGALPGEGDDAYIDSFRSARREADDPVFRALDDHAEAWAPLVPDEMGLRVVLFGLFCDRYEVVRKKAKRFCQAFGVDDPEFVAEYERRWGEPIEDAFARPAGLFGRRGRKDR